MFGSGWEGEGLGLCMEEIEGSSPSGESNGLWVIGWIGLIGWTICLGYFVGYSAMFDEGLFGYC